MSSFIVVAHKYVEGKWRHLDVYHYEVFDAKTPSCNRFQEIEEIQKKPHHTCDYCDEPFLCKLGPQSNLCVCLSLEPDDVFWCSRTCFDKSIKQEEDEETEPQLSLTTLNLSK